MGFEVVDKGTLVHLANLVVQSELLTRIKAAQYEDLECAKIKQLLEEGKTKEFCLKDDGLLTHFKQVYVPESRGLRKEIMSEAHHSLYTIHPSVSKHEWIILMEQYEARYHKVCRVMLNLSTNESREH